MNRKLPGAAATALLTLALLALAPQARALDLVEFTFGSGVGTDTAQHVAAHLRVSPVVGHQSGGAVAPHTFIDLGEGNMAAAQAAQAQRQQL